MEGIQIQLQFASGWKPFQREIFVCFAEIENGQSTMRRLLGSRDNELRGCFFWQGSGEGAGPAVYLWRARLSSTPSGGSTTSYVLFLTGVRGDALYPSPEAPVGRRLLAAAAPLPVACRAARHVLRLKPRLPETLLSGNGHRLVEKTNTKCVVSSAAALWGGVGGVNSSLGDGFALSVLCKLCRCCRNVWGSRSAHGRASPRRRRKPGPECPPLREACQALIPPPRPTEPAGQSGDWRLKK